MEAALKQFRANIERARTLTGIYSVLKGSTTEALDLSDVLRAALVMAVSCLDQYVHEIVRIGMFEVFRWQRPETDAFLKFSISLESVRRIALDPSDEQWIENEVRQHHSWQSFEHPDRIADAIRLISNINLWDTVAAELGCPVADVKQKLRLIVDRRNKIAHEADINPTFPGDHWPIDEPMVSEAITFVEQVVSNIHSAINKLDLQA